MALYSTQRFASIFVTHSVSEAAFMASRVLVMTPRPGRVIAEFTVPFEYPRPPEVRYEPEFARLAGDIAESLQVSS